MMNLWQKGQNSIRREIRRCDRMFTKVLEKDPKNKTAWNNKGLALGKFGRVLEAIDCYNKALEINPKDHVVLNNKGNALFKKGLSMSI